jgi:hypothetical protein
MEGLGRTRCRAEFESPFLVEERQNSSSLRRPGKSPILGRLLRCLDRGVEGRLSKSQRSFRPLRVAELSNCTKLDNPPSRSRSAPRHRCRHRRRFGRFLHISPKTGPKSWEVCRLASDQTTGGRCNLSEFDWLRIAGGDLDRRSLAAQNRGEPDLPRVQPDKLCDCPKKCLAERRYGILILR